MSDIDRDDVIEWPLDLIPLLRVFPIESYARILATGRAAATKKRYDTREEARREAVLVSKSIRYYQRVHPELAPEEHSVRVWDSAEDGRYRWAILPMRHPRRLTPNRDSRSRRGAPR